MTKKKLTFVFLFFVSVTFASGPQISVEPPEHDFGDIHSGDKVSTNFIIKNTGDEVLKIIDVRASCGCTAAKPDKDELKPGETTNLTVTFNSKGRMGQQTKMVYITTNDSENKEVKVKLTGNVIKEQSMLQQDKAFFKNN